MISSHRLTHALQMYTPGPAMSLPTLLSAFPQNEQRSEPSIHFGARDRLITDQRIASLAT